MDDEPDDPSRSAGTGYSFWKPTRFVPRHDGLSRLEVGQDFFVSMALGGGVDFQTPGDKPTVLTPEARHGLALHGFDS